jgi:hypothetical protein
MDHDDVGTPDEPLDRRRGVHRSPRSGVHRPRKPAEGEPVATDDTPPAAQPVAKPAAKPARKAAPRPAPVKPPPPVPTPMAAYDDPAAGEQSSGDVASDELVDEPMPRFEHAGTADWYDDDAGPLVRPYTVTGGRVRPSSRVLDLIDFVIAVPGAEADLPNLQPEHVAILMAAREYISVAELAAGLDLALGVIRVLLDDLIRQGLIALRDPQRSTTVDDHLLKAVIDGLRSL